MAKSFSGVFTRSFQSDANDRVAVSGKAGLVFEIVQAAASAGAITLYNSNATAYSTSPTTATTGAAILQNIKFLHTAIPMYEDSTLNDITTTVAMMYGLRKVNGPTTVAQIGVHNNNDGVLYTILCAGTGI